MSIVKYIPLTTFMGPNNRKPAQHAAPAIIDLAEHIAAHGLLNPVLIHMDGAKVSIIDGQKRIAALIYLRQTRRLSPIMSDVPCEYLPASVLPFPKCPAPPQRWSASEFAHFVWDEAARGTSLSQIAKTLYCDIASIAKAASLTALHPDLLNLYKLGHLSLAQSAALATIPYKKAQYDLLIQLGPFVESEAIIQKIADNETALELPNGDVLILPSRAPRTSIQREIAKAA